MTIYLYARMSKLEATITCQQPSCRHQWEHRRGTQVVCPKCRVQQETELPNSIETQKHLMQQAVDLKFPNKQNRGEVIFVYDIESAGSKQFAVRENGKRVYLALKDGDHVFVAALDRGWRDARDFLNCVYTWQNKGVHLHAIRESIDTSTPIGKCIATILAAVAEMEWHSACQRRKDSVARRRAQGRPTNCWAQYGYNVRKHPVTRIAEFVDNPDEQKFMIQVYLWRTVHHWQWQAILNECERLKLRTRSGRPWMRQGLQRVFRETRDLIRSGKLQLPSQYANKPRRQSGADHHHVDALADLQQK